MLLLLMSNNNRRESPVILKESITCPLEADAPTILDEENERELVYAECVGTKIWSLTLYWWIELKHCEVYAWNRRSLFYTSSSRCYTFFLPTVYCSVCDRNYKAFVINTTKNNYSRYSYYRNNANNLCLRAIASLTSDPARDVIKMARKCQSMF